MSSFFLDAGAAGLIWYAYTLMFFFMVIAILIEAVIMQIMKYTTLFRKALIDSLLVNMASLVVGYVLFRAFNDFFGYYSVASMAVLYLVTVLIEFFLLRLLNRQHTSRSTLQVVAVMNLATYSLLYLVGNWH